jgi:CheY-like chemotaxis protein
MGTPGPARILVVDDAATIREVCAELIRDLGYEVDVVADAGEALDRLRTERFDAVVTDIMMPGMDGWQLMAAAIREQPMLRLVVMTGAAVEGDRERALALGVPLLQKPFTREELREALQVATAPVDHQGIEPRPHDVDGPNGSGASETTA